MSGWDGASGVNGWDDASGQDDAIGSDTASWADPGGRALTWRTLPPEDRVAWFEWLWRAVVSLGTRYRLAVRTGWWADERQLEVLAALAGWVERYDSGEWDDPPGKLSLLFDLERVAAALREGAEPFHPDRDRFGFDRHVEEIIRTSL